LKQCERKKGRGRGHPPKPYNLLMDLIEEIKNKIGIVQLAEAEGLKLKKQSDRIYKACCCFHKEIVASLTLYADTNTFKCYGCQARGDAINFYAKRHDLTNAAAIKTLARLLELKRPAGGVKPVKTAGLRAKGGGETTPGQAKGYKQRLDSLYRALQAFCGPVDSESLTYLTSESRGLTAETIKHFGIFSISDYQKTRAFLLSLASLKTLKELMVFDSKNRFGFTKNKIIIPVIEDGRIIALRGRYFDRGFSDPTITTARYTYPKYKSTTGIAGKLFNGDILKTLKPGDRVYLCEGEFDTMITHQHGHNAVGLFGVSNYTDATIKRLNGFDLVIAFDNDEPGKSEALKVGNIFYKQTGIKDYTRNKLPDGIKDLTELFTARAKKKNENLQS